MKKLPVNYDSEVLPDLLKVLIRIEELESGSNSIGRDIEIKDLEWTSNSSQFKRETHQSKEHIKDLHARVRKIKLDFVDVVNEFRNKATTEDFEKLKKIVDEWHPENYISRHEFLRRIEDIKEERSKLRKF